MCGVAGIVRFDAPGRAHEARARELCRRLAHRGPDGDGLWLGSHAALGHTRLALIDREHGAQPLVSPDGRWVLVYSGEIYRCDAPLAWTPRVRCDAELVLAALARGGADALGHLDGMFALALWDEQRGVGLLARDRLGIKPLAYRWDGRELVFASEAGPLARERLAPRADLDAVIEYLAAPCFSGVERSPFEGVRYLQPGELLQIDASGVATRRWAPRVVPAPGVDDDTSVAGHADALREALPGAIARVRRADVPVGCFLSGGLDSTLIAALAPGAPALSARYGDHGRFDEGASRLVVSDDVPAAAHAVRALGVADHAWVDLPAAPDAAELIALGGVDDALPAWEQELTQARLFRAASERGLRAVMVGDAADETHHGYHFLLDDAATASPEALLARFAGVPLRREVCADPVATLGRRYRALAASWGLGWGSRDEGLCATAALIRERFLPRLLHNGDIHSMHWSVEARVPFGDAALLASADAVPLRAALAGGVEKRVLREAARGLVPEPIRVRRKSALPKPPRVDAAYRAAASEVAAAPHPLLERIIDLDALRALIAREPLEERERGALFRVIGLDSWAKRFEVRPP